MIVRNKSGQASAAKDTAIVVVNLLVDMVERGKPFPMPPDYGPILSRTVSFVKRAREAGYPIIFIQDQHRPDDKEFTDFTVGQPHAIRDTDGSQLIPELSPLDESDYSVNVKPFLGQSYLLPQGLCLLFEPSGSQQGL